MMPMTPSGTRICATRMPLGRMAVAPRLPMGSGMSAICSRPAAMVSMALSDSFRRSSRAGASWFFSAAARSRAFSACKAALSCCRRAAMARSACALAFPGALRIRRAAWRAWRPSMLMSVMTASVLSAAKEVSVCCVMAVCVCVLLGIIPVFWMPGMASGAMSPRLGLSGDGYAQGQPPQFFPGVVQAAGHFQPLDQAIDVVRMLDGGWPGPLRHSGQGLAQQLLARSKDSLAAQLCLEVLARRLGGRQPRQHADLFAY